MRTEYIVNPIHSMIVASSGPLMSALIALLFANVRSYGYLLDFQISNTVIFLLNIFPVLPLDGGNFLNSFLTYRVGYIKAHLRMIEITRVGGVFFGFFGIIFLLLSKYNISLLVISGFLLYNLREERKKLVFLRKMIFTKEFDRNGNGIRVKHMAVVEQVMALALTDYFGYNFVCHFFVYDHQMALLGTLTQSEIIDGIIEHGAEVTVGKLLGGTNEHKG